MASYHSRADDVLFELDFLVLHLKCMVSGTHYLGLYLAAMFLTAIRVFGLLYNGPI